MNLIMVSSKPEVAKAKRKTIDAYEVVVTLNSNANYTKSAGIKKYFAKIGVKS